MIIKNILLNKSKTRIINIIFEIDKTESIGLFHLDLLLRIIEFYIINAKILFLLLFKDINKFNIYYNNIINTIIINKTNHIRNRLFTKVTLPQQNQK